MRGAERRQALVRKRRTRWPALRSGRSPEIRQGSPADDVGRRASRRSTVAFLSRRRAALSSGLPPDRQPAPGRRLVVASRAEPRRRPGAVRAKHGAQAPHQTGGSRPRPSTEGWRPYISARGPHLRPQPGRLEAFAPRRHFIDPLRRKTPHEAPSVSRVAALYICSYRDARNLFSQFCEVGLRGQRNRIREFLTDHHCNCPTSRRNWAQGALSFCRFI
jgi:hypothetical protein